MRSIIQGHEIDYPNNKVVPMSVLRRLLIVTSALIAFSSITQSAFAEASPQFDKAALKARFEKLGVAVLSVEPSMIEGVVEINTDNGVLFSSLTGESFISGTLYSLDEKGNYVDVLAERQAPLNAAKIDTFADEMIVYPAEDEKYVITVLTDITCGYCVRLHSQMSGYNQLGITVRYLAYPRQGPSGDVAENMAKVWCADDPAQAMSDAKINQKFDSKVADLDRCKQSIANQYNLGRELGISGTPAIFLSNGKLIAGYMPPASLIQRLQVELAE
jgi:thiol:disulfide interchange protein DsbC